MQKEPRARELVLAGRAEGPTSSTHSQNPGLEFAAKPNLREHHIAWPKKMSHPITLLWLPEGCVGSTEHELPSQVSPSVSAASSWLPVIQVCCTYLRSSNEVSKWDLRYLHAMGDGLGW